MLKTYKKKFIKIKKYLQIKLAGLKLLNMFLPSFLPSWMDGWMDGRISVKPLCKDCLQQSKSIAN
jgi:hypothetical protein